MTTIRALHERLTAEVRGSTNRGSRKLANNTYGHIEPDGTVVVRLHNTDIVRVSTDAAEYNTGGWFTVTTKERINRYTPDVRVSSRKSIWEIWRIGQWDQPLSRFTDGITLIDTDHGVDVQGGRLTGDPDEAMRKALNRYVALYTDDRIAELVAKAVSGGTLGDCLPCQMGNDHAFGGDHLLLHVAESYTMATLARNAIEKAGYRPDIYLGMFHPDHYRPGSGRFYGETVRRAIRKMLKANLLNKGLTLPTAEELEMV